MENSDVPYLPRKRQKLDVAHVEPIQSVVSSSDDYTYKPPTKMEFGGNESHKEVMAGAALLFEGEMTSDQDKGAMPASVSVRDDLRSKELQVGIKELVNPDLPGFSGILKKR